MIINLCVKKIICRVNLDNIQDYPVSFASFFFRLFFNKLWLQRTFWPIPRWHIRQIQNWNHIECNNAKNLLFSEWEYSTLKIFIHDSGFEAVALWSNKEHLYTTYFLPKRFRNQTHIKNKIWAVLYNKEYMDLLLYGLLHFTSISYLQPSWLYIINTHTRKYMKRNTFGMVARIQLNAINSAHRLHSKFIP